MNESFRGHMDNIHKLVEEGKLIVAGPLGKNENNYRGIVVLNNIKSIEEAKELLQTDLAIKSRILQALPFLYTSIVVVKNKTIYSKGWEITQWEKAVSMSKNFPILIRKFKKNDTINN